MNEKKAGCEIHGFGTIFIVFLILKLTGTITWSWWWVTAPLWIPYGLLFGVLLISFLIIGLCTFIDEIL